MSSDLLSVGTNNPGIGQHLTPNNSDRNEFDIFNSNFEYNSIYKIWDGFENTGLNVAQNASNYSNETYSQPISGFKELSVGVPDSLFNPSVWNCSLPMFGFNVVQNGLFGWPHTQDSNQFSIEFNSISNGLKLDINRWTIGSTQPMNVVRQPAQDFLKSFNNFNGLSDCLGRRQSLNDSITVSSDSNQLIIGFKFNNLPDVEAQTAGSFVWSDGSTFSEPNGRVVEPLIQSVILPEEVPLTEKLFCTSFWDNLNKLSAIDDQSDLDFNNNEVRDRYEFLDNKSEVSNRLPIQPTPKSQWSSNSYFSEDCFRRWFRQPKISRRIPAVIECVFCKNNNERPEFYKSHILKDPESNILCPVLRAYDCPICHNGGGSRAHTIRYCPLKKFVLQSKIEQLIKIGSPIKKIDHKKSGKYRKKYK